MTDEALLVARAQQGDKSALTELVEAHHQTVYNVARRMCGNEHDAEETLQETFLNAIAALPRFENRSRLSTWLYRIATNQCLQRRRAAGSGSAPLPVEELDRDNGDTPRLFVDWSGLPEDALLDDELREVMEAAIAALPPDLRIVFIWRDLEGRSTAETAAIVGISEANVKVRLHRARLALREQLSAYFAERPQEPSA
jgi:RNA polymerase sigma-70 factor (ECF subfamily)